MRVVVIGGSGHVGTYLVPRLVALGHEVINISRKQREPYQAHGAWDYVQQVQSDRTAEEKDGSFGKRVADLKPDIVVDMICFKPESAVQLADAIRGQVQHLLHCGTIWVHGHSVQVPTTEEQPRSPLEEYGRNKGLIEAYLLEHSRMHGLPSTILHPGHIVGPGWPPVNPAAHFSPHVFEKLARGEELALPNFGLETVHHVHADDVAQSFVQAISNWGTSTGESFHVVSAAALTLRGYAESVAGWFGKTANLKFLPWEEWSKTVSKYEAETAWSHVAHSPNASIAKAQRLLDYRPRYSSLQAVREALDWMIAEGTVKV